MKFFTLLSFISLYFCATVQAQQVTYNIPKPIKTEKASFTFEKVKAGSSSYYINYKAENTGNGLLLIDRNKASLFQNGGELHPLSSTYMIKPGEKKTIYNEVRVKAPVKAYADELDFQIGGVQYAIAAGPSIEAGKFTLAEKATHTAGNFNIKVMEYNVRTDRVYVQIKCTYNGGANRIGGIDLKKVNVEGGKGEIVKKGDYLLSGKSYTFAINITPEQNTFTLDWQDALKEMKLVSMNLDKVNIRSTNFKEKFKPVHAVNGAYKTYSDKSAKPNRMVIFNAAGEGFKVEIDGAQSTPFYTTHANLGVDDGNLNVKIFVDGISDAVFTSAIQWKSQFGFAKYELKKDKNHVYSLTYVENSGTAKGTKPNTSTPTTGQGNSPAPEKGCALSYDDFMTLKKDIQTASNSGGKPVPMAIEYLSVKGCLSTAQVVDLMGAFNLDSPKLEFAKQAYRYTSDKHKYYLAVQKLSYNKNKEALEEFIGQQ